MWLPAAITAAASIFGGERANNANAKMAQRQMDFQERMRSTQYQTAVEDMKKAGLNPALAYSQGGAGTPTGSSIPQHDSISPGVTSAMSMMATKANIEKTKADAAKANQEAKQLALESLDRLMELRARANLSSASAYDIESTRQARREEIWARTFAANQRGHVDQKEATFLENIANERIARFSAETRNDIASAVLAELALPGARNQEAFQRSIFGKIAPYVSSAKDALQNVIPAIILRGRMSKGRSGTRTRTTQRVGKDWSETFEQWDEH